MGSSEESDVRWRKERGSPDFSPEAKVSSQGFPLPRGRHKRMRTKSPGWIFLGFGIDRSGSMRSMGSEVASGFNSMIRDQQTKCASGNCSVSVVRFNQGVDVLHNNVNIRNVGNACDEDFYPLGGTALYDAIQRTINLVRDGVIRHIRNGGQPPSKVIITIITDGIDNSSECNVEEVRKDIRRVREELGWEFVYVGANQDAVEVGRQMGMDPNQCLSFDADPEHGATTFRSLSDNLTRQCTGDSFCGFTPMERAESSSQAPPAGLYCSGTPVPPPSPPPPPPPVPQQHPLDVVRPPLHLFEAPLSPKPLDSLQTLGQTEEDARDPWELALKF